MTTEREAQKVSQGWQRVPMDPTPEMIRAGWQHHPSAFGDQIIPAMYASMLKAAPQPPQQVAVPQGWVEALARELCLWDQEDPDYVLDCGPTGDKLMWHRQDIKASKLIAAMLKAAPQPPQQVAVPQARVINRDWLYSVLRYANKNPNYFPDVEGTLYAGDTDAVIAAFAAPQPPQPPPA